MKKQDLRMKKHLVTCIESHLGWGTGDSWTNKDFKDLSDQIFKVTGKRLSVTTLKRIWGRAEVVANPSVTTFDILSEFVGYESWRDFQQAHSNGRSTGKLSKIPYGFWKWGIGSTVILLLALFFLRGGKNPNEARTTPKAEFPTENVSFSFEKVAIGYPNTVIFQYDLGPLSPDSMYIQQSWDSDKRIPLHKAKGLVTSTYYLPGYFLTKLMANEQILLERELYIPTQGWQGLLLGDGGEITYLKPEEFYKGEYLGIRSGVLEKMDGMEGGELYLAQLSPNPSIDGTDFSMATTFRMPKSSEHSICRSIRMTVTGTREVISLEFSIPGCVGDLGFFMDNEMISGRNHDLSAFGRDMGQWTRCELKVSDGMLTIVLDDQIAFQKELKVDLGKIGGVQWTFEGQGEIKELVLEDEQQQWNLLK
ncbi:hypothetical protein FGF1_00750 [Flavobacteriaceae bacterium GF1]